MALGDQGSTIYQTQGSTVVSSTTLGFGCVNQFYILPSKRKVIAPDLCNGTVGTVAYPAGGPALKTISGGLQSPGGAVLSQQRRKRSDPVKRGAFPISHDAL